MDSSNEDMRFQVTNCNWKVQARLVDKIWVGFQKHVHNKEETVERYFKPVKWSYGGRGWLLTLIVSYKLWRNSVHYTSQQSLPSLFLWSFPKNSPFFRSFSIRLRWSHSICYYTKRRNILHLYDIVNVYWFVSIREFWNVGSRCGNSGVERPHQ